MSYDLVAWEGERPADDKAAARGSSGRRQRRSGGSS
jgi:hypothetical protein